MPVFNSTLYAWNVLKPINLHFLQSLKQIALAREEGALLLSKCGDVYAIGKSATGWLGLRNVTETEKPVKIEKLSNVEGIYLCSIYGNALAFTKDGKLYTWGHNDGDHGLYGLYNEEEEFVGLIPTLNYELENIFIVDAQCVGGRYIALTKNGKVYVWKGVKSYNNTNGPTRPKLMAFDANTVIVSIACSEYHCLALGSNGKIYMWGLIYKSNGTSSTETRKLYSIPGEVVCKIFCAKGQNLVLTQSLKLFTWGYDKCYLGNGNCYASSPAELTYNGLRFVDCCNAQAAKLESGGIVVWGSGASDLTLKPFEEMHQVFANKSDFLVTLKASDAINLNVCGQLCTRIKGSFNDKKTSDLTIKIGDRCLYLHRFILNACSNFLRVMLQSHWTNKDESEINLSSFKYEVYESYFWFLYSGEIKSDLNNVLELCHIADMYNEPDLKKGAVLLMKRNLKYEDLVDQYIEEIALKRVQILAEKRENQETHVAVKKNKKF